MIDTTSFYEMLVDNGIDYFAGVPDSLLKDLCACISDKSSKGANIITANEGNAVALCAGHYLATGRVGAAYMQNSGLGNAVNPLLSLTDPEVYSIPVLLIIGWRGEPGVNDEPQHRKQGEITCRMLETMNIGYEIIGPDSKASMKKAVESLKESKPYALVIRKGTFSSYKAPQQPNEWIMKREQALDIILSKTAQDDIIVSTTGKTSREVFELREKNGQDHGNDFLTVGSMGHTSSIAYGIASGTDQNVYCIDGDGSFIMHMGALAVIGSNPLPNFKYIINDNGSHESVGGQPTCSPRLDLPSILRGFGFEEVYEASDEKMLSEMMDSMKEEGMKALIIKTNVGSRPDLGRPNLSPKENKKVFTERIKQNKNGE